MSMSPQLTTIGFVMANVHSLVSKFLDMRMEHFIAYRIYIIAYIVYEYLRSKIKSVYKIAMDKTLREK